MKECDMTKEQVIEVIKKNIVANIDDVDPATIDPQKSMKDYGANSLDMIEVVSTSMRELKIKVPRSELADINNIDQLAEKFLQYVTVA
jgi:acyl carrier protein